MKPALRANLLLLLASLIWGFAFVAQRIGMKYIGPLTFNGLRFSLGGLVLVPFLFRRIPGLDSSSPNPLKSKRILLALGLTGLLLFCGATLQQFGIQSTTAGKAGFITGLYVVFVPFAGIFLKHKSDLFVWIGVALSTIGLFLLSIKSGLSMERGDFLVLLCAIVFTGHVLLIGWLSPQMDSFYLAIIQFAICGLLSLAGSLIFEQPACSQVINGAVPVLYGGIFSVGIAFTLQVIGQKEARPATAAILLSMEAVFAAFGGWLILNEFLTFRAIAGCWLMLAGMFISQFKNR